MSGAALTETVARYNSFVAEGVDKDFKKPTPMHKIEKPPFYAAWSTPILHDTLTGLAHQHQLAGDRHPRRGDPGPLLRRRIAGRLRPARPGALHRVRPHRRPARGEEYGLRRDDGGHDERRHAHRDEPRGLGHSGRGRRPASASAVKVGAKSSAGCALGGCRVEVLDGDGAVVASGRARRRAVARHRRAVLEPRSSCARRPRRGSSTLAVRFDAGELDEPHDGASSPFSVAVVARARAYADRDGRRPAACRSRTPSSALGPIRATTDAAGRGRAQTGQGPLRARGLEGRLRRAAGAARRSTPTPPSQVEARALPEDDPDAVWTA